jgi:hypothetical protein
MQSGDEHPSTWLPLELESGGWPIARIEAYCGRRTDEIEDFILAYASTGTFLPMAAAETLGERRSRSRRRERNHRILDEWNAFSDLQGMHLMFQPVGRFTRLITEERRYLLRSVPNGAILATSDLERRNETPSHSTTVAVSFFRETFSARWSFVHRNGQGRCKRTPERLLIARLKYQCFGPLENIIIYDLEQLFTFPTAVASPSLSRRPTVRLS